MPVAMRRAHLRGIVAMLLAVILFALMDSAMKLLAVHYPAVQIAALRGLSALPLVGLWVAARRALPSLLRVRWPLHLLRGMLGVLMLSLFAYALRTLPLAEAYTIYFIAPLLIVLLASLVLHERVSASRWIAVAGGLLGVVIVLRPGGEQVLSLAALAVLGSAVCYALVAITTRAVSRTDSNESIVFWFTLSIGLGAGLLALPGWVSLQQVHWPLVLVLAVTGSLAQFLITEAFRHAEASAVAPFEYTALAWAAGLDWLLWGLLPDRYTLSGAAIIIGSGLYLIHAERRSVLDRKRMASG